MQLPQSNEERGAHLPCSSFKFRPFFFTSFSSVRAMTATALTPYRRRRSRCGCEFLNFTCQSVTHADQRLLTAPREDVDDGD